MIIKMGHNNESKGTSYDERKEKEKEKRFQSTEDHDFVATPFNSASFSLLSLLAPFRPCIRIGALI